MKSITLNHFCIGCVQSSATGLGSTKNNGCSLNNAFNTTIMCFDTIYLNLIKFYLTILFFL